MDDIDVSVVIPVYNDTDGIRTTIHSIVTQSVRTYDVFPVDNDSTDGTGGVIREIANEHSDLVRPCKEIDVQSSYAARNTGIEHASGDVLLFLDADIWVPETWIEDMVTTLESNDYDYLGCNVEVVAEDRPNFWERYEQSFSFPVETYLEDKHFAPTCALAVRREVFEEVGLFDERLESGGDKEFGNRVHEAGYDLHYANDVTMYHPTRNSLRAHVKKDRRVGRGLCQLQRYHPDRYGTPGVPPRPSGIKRPDRDLPTRDRLAFGALSRLLTAVRGVGYCQEYLTGEKATDLEGVPRLED